MPRLRAHLSILLVLVTGGLAGCFGNDAEGARDEAFAVLVSPERWSLGQRATYSLAEDAAAQRILVVVAEGERVPGESWWLMSVGDVEHGSVVRSQDVLVRKSQFEIASVSHTFGDGVPISMESYPATIRVGDSWSLGGGEAAQTYRVRDAGEVSTPSGLVRAVTVEKRGGDGELQGSATFARGWHVPVRIVERLVEGGHVTWVLDALEPDAVTSLVEVTRVGGPGNAEIQTLRHRTLTGWSEPYPVIRYERGDDIINTTFHGHLVDSLLWLRNETDPRFPVVAWWDNGASLEGFAHRAALAIGPSPDNPPPGSWPRWIEPNALPEDASGVHHYLARILLSDPRTAANLMESIGARHLLLDGRLVPIDDPRSPSLDAAGIFPDVPRALGEEVGQFVRIEARVGGQWFPYGEAPSGVDAHRLIYEPAFFRTMLFNAWGGTAPGQGARDGEFWDSVLRRPHPGWDSGGRWRVVHVDPTSRVMETFPGALLVANVTLHGHPVEAARVEVWDDAGDVIWNVIPEERRGLADPRAYDVRQNSALTDMNGTANLRVPWSGERGLLVVFPDFRDEGLPPPAYTLHVSPEEARRGATIRVDFELTEQGAWE